MRGTMMNTPLTLVPFAERAATLYPKVEIVSRLPDKSLHRSTYAEIAERARALAGALQAAGVAPGDRVATLCWNHYAHLEAYLGIPMAGAILHTLNLRLFPDDIAFIARHAADRILIVDDVLLPLYEKIRGKVAFEKIIVVPLTGAAPDSEFEDYERFLEGGGDRYTPVALDENDGAAMCYTSGTTGDPKGVIYSHRALTLHSLALGLVDTIAISQNEAIMPVVPMFHANAWGLPFAATLLGARQVFPGPYLDGESLLDLMAETGVTFAAGVPTIWLDVIQRLEAAPDRWVLDPKLRTIVGGAACPESLIRRYHAQGIAVLHAWGMTEMSPVGTVCNIKPDLGDLPEDAAFRLRATQGLPVPFVDIRLVGDEGVGPWDGETMGELEVRGPWIAARYHDNPEAQDHWSADGWFRTGDVVTIDPEGYVKITDRTKDLIKSGGEWISSVDIENALMGHPAVAEAAVIALPHPKWSERPLAAVVLAEGKEASAEDLRRHLAERFAKWWVPDAIVFVDEIPRTSTGKFQKRTLRERFKDWTWPDEVATG